MWARRQPYGCNCSVGARSSALHPKLKNVAQVAEEFQANQAMPLLPANAAPHSGAILWVRGLRDRIAGAT